MINFNKYFKLFNIISIILITSSILLLIFKGLNFGIDFKGGTLIELRASDEKITITSLRDSLKNPWLKQITIENIFLKTSKFIWIGIS